MKVSSDRRSKQALDAEEYQRVAQHLKGYSSDFVVAVNCPLVCWACNATDAITAPATNEVLSDKYAKRRADVSKRPWHLGAATRYAVLDCADAGTLGTKHNPESLAQLAEPFRSRPNVRIIVISEGGGTRYLQKRKVEAGLDNLVLMPS
jgi:hypothetical protein